MSRTLFRCALLAGALSLGPAMQGQSRFKDAFRPLSVDLAVTYTAERAKIATIDCGCFWLQGGGVNAAVPVYHGLSVAASFTGEHSSGIRSGLNLSKLAFVAGPRYSFDLRRWTGGRSSIFGTEFLTRHASNLYGEALFGFARGFDSLFPTSAGLVSSANSFAMQIGGGLNMTLARRFGLRALEIHYERTSLPNSVGDTQNDLRLSMGVTYHFGRSTAP